MTDLSVTLMAPVQVSGTDGSVRPRSGHERGLIARLALSAGSVVPNDDLCSALWGRRTPPSTRSNLRKYTSGVRAALRSVGAPHELIVVPAGRGSHASGGVRLDVSPAEVDVLAAEAAARTASRLLLTSPRDARDVAERGIRLLTRGAFGSDLPVTDWFSEYGRWVDRHRLRLREIRCVADLVAGDIFPATLEAERLADESESSYAYLRAAALFFDDQSMEALNVISRHRRSLAEFGLDLPRTMTDLQLGILNADGGTVRRTLVASTTGAR